MLFFGALLHELFDFFFLNRLGIIKIWVIMRTLIYVTDVH
jgi:hypothetical protein